MAGGPLAQPAVDLARASRCRQNRRSSWGAVIVFGSLTGGVRPERRIAVDGGREGEGFPVFPLTPQFQLTRHAGISISQSDTLPSSMPGHVGRVKGSADSLMGPRGRPTPVTITVPGAFTRRRRRITSQGQLDWTAARSAASGGPCFFVSRWRSSTQSGSAPSVSLSSAALPIQSERGGSPASRAESS